MLFRNRKRLKPLKPIAIKTHGWLRVAMPLATLAGFKGFNAELIENLDGVRDAWIKKGIPIGFDLLTREYR
jgi:hypothetical protein